MRVKITEILVPQWLCLCGILSFPPPLPTHYIRPGFIAYQKGKVSRARLAEYYDTSLFDLKTVLLEYGFDEDENYETQIHIAETPSGEMTAFSE